MRGGPFLLRYPLFDIVVRLDVIVRLIVVHVVFFVFFLFVELVLIDVFAFLEVVFFVYVVFPIEVVVASEGVFVLENVLLFDGFAPKLVALVRDIPNAVKPGVELGMSVDQDVVAARKDKLPVPSGSAAPTSPSRTRSSKRRSSVTRRRTEALSMV